jgi:hypothetical protein
MEQIHTKTNLDILISTEKDVDLQKTKNDEQSVKIP